jgi:hypothetical protein
LQLAHIDEMFTNNRDPDEIFQALQKIYKENDANSNNIEVQWRLAKACLQRGLNLSNERSADKDERRAILDQGTYLLIELVRENIYLPCSIFDAISSFTGVNWASKALSQNPRHFESLKYK